MPFRSGKKRWGVAALLALGAAALLAGCENSPTILDPAGPVAKREADLFWFIFIVATVVFVAVTSVLIYSVFRFRARPEGAAPRQVHGNTTIELAWTIGPSLVLFAVLAVTITTMFGLAQPASANVVTVRAIGHQWWWEFQYPDQRIVTADEMHIPTGTVVHIDLVSDNVIHSFWVPQLGGKTDVIPGHDNTMWLQADRAGQYRGECAEFCGAQHAHMDFMVVAESNDSFQSWVTQEQQHAQAPTDSLAQQGQKIFSQKCVGCHLIDGVNQPNKAQIGPNLTHFGSRKLIAGYVLDNTPENLAEWLRDPQAVKPGNDMPNLHLSQGQIDALVVYLEGLK
ncbi:MAG TPA: cytochrome c oxidase subunit II [Ktedonobacterales bacterium]|nr:cytochrome c oxidase subunit II [Ktedonobacterales bacterium]